MQVDIADSVMAVASAASTLRAIDDYFLEHMATADSPAILPIRVEVGALIVEHLVTASMSSRRNYLEPNGLALQWVPTHDALYPAFQGTLHIKEDKGRCQIEIRGSYTPPFGRPGAVFDAMLGRRVAHATLLELLGRLRFRAEAAYRAHLA